MYVLIYHADETNFDWSYINRPKVTSKFSFSQRIGLINERMQFFSENSREFEVGNWKSKVCRAVA